MKKDYIFTGLEILSENEESDDVILRLDSSQDKNLLEAEYSITTELKHKVEQ